MIIAIISDIHANLEALTVAINFIVERNTSKILCCGDIVGYGPDPSACINLLRRYDFKSVYGNHDKAILSDSIGIYFNEDALVALNIQKTLLNAEQIEFIKKLPFTISEDDFILTHSFLSKKDPYKYVLDEKIAAENIALTKKQTLFIGHSHIPGCIVFEGKNIKYISAFDGLRINIEKGKRYLINVGSVGQPRDGNPQLSVCLYNTENNLIEIVRLSYKVDLTVQKMIETGFPKNLYKRLSLGL
ncbi:MAG TPA: metallophosphoesterase family protein, partial [Caldisericia bacterium]|nr:metallophosphoesterase family protein [Caldisericia bacterium]